MENESLVADLVDYVAKTPRSYQEVMTAWRTSCPRLTIWEDAIDNGLLAVRGQAVEVTDDGARFLRSRSSLRKAWNDRD